MLGMTKSTIHRGGCGPSLRKAVFLDRDGVLNAMIQDPGPGRHDSPYRPEEMELLPGVVRALRSLNEAGYLLVIISNQPGAAKGRCRIEDLERVHAAFYERLGPARSLIAGSYLCFHHPDSVLPKLRRRCECRKPGNLLLRQARQRFGIDLASSWMVGDRDIDVQCGQSLGLATILIEYPFTPEYRGASTPDHRAASLAEAAETIRRLAQVPSK